MSTELTGVPLRLMLTWAKRGSSAQKELGIQATFTLELVAPGNILSGAGMSVTNKEDNITVMRLQGLQLRAGKGGLPHFITGLRNTFQRSTGGSVTVDAFRLFPDSSSRDARADFTKEVIEMLKNYFDREAKSNSDLDELLSD